MKLFAMNMNTNEYKIRSFKRARLVFGNCLILKWQLNTIHTWSNTNWFKMGIRTCFGNFFYFFGGVDSWLSWRTIHEWQNQENGWNIYNKQMNSPTLFLSHILSLSFSPVLLRLWQTRRQNAFKKSCEKINVLLKWGLIIFTF